MRGNKLTRAVSDAKELVSSILSDSHNRIALISFGSTSSILSTFTNDEATLLGILDNLSTTGCTNYYAALQNVDTVMTNYQKETNRELITLFLTDGYPNEDTPNQKGMYAVLKDKYPYMTINGVQYEMGTDVIQEIIEVSDNQFIANKDTLNNILFEASGAENYENFIITDYVDNDYFTISSVNDIKVNKGEVTLTEENGVPKITWVLSENVTGFDAHMEINLTLKNQYVGVDGYYPTNKRESITSKLPEEEPKTVNSSLTPVLKNAYTVYYDVNTPARCNLPSVNSEEHALFSTVTINQNALSCSGWTFKGWEIQDSDDDVLHINSDMFVMPEHDVTIRGTWGKQTITKTMDGIINTTPTPCTDFGRDDWETIVSCVQAGNTDNYHVGDTKEVDMGTLGTHTLRVANNSNYDCTLESQTACGFVLEFADIITTHVMNSTDTNSGGFPASELYSYLNTESTGIYNSLPTELKNAIIGTTVVSGHGSGDANNFTTNNVKIYPLSYVEVYGSNHTYDTVTTSETRQLDYYSNAGVTSNYSGAIKQLNGTNSYWWLRSAVSGSSTHFWIVNIDGNGYNFSGANFTGGVSPAFRLAGPDSCSNFINDSWSTIVSNVQAGTTSRYPVGCTKSVTLSNSLGTHTLRVANNSNYDCTLESQTACGFVLEFADIITNHVMNSTRTNSGGFPASEMYSYLNGTSGTTIYNSLPSELKDAIIGTTVVSGHGSGDANNFTTNNVKIYPLSFVEVYGSNDTYDTVTTSDTRQLDYYSNAGVTTSNYSGARKQRNGTNYLWWLRSATSYNSISFWNVATNGNGSHDYANNPWWVSPAFRLRA